MNKIHIGIDPGKNGFITLMTNKNIQFFSIPKIGNEVDIHKLNNIFSSIRIEDEGKSIHCVIEDVHAIFGSSAKSTFEFGRVNGLIESILVCNGIPYTKVQPKIWQKEMFSGIALQKKPSSTGKTMKNDTKLMALMAAKRLFPDMDFTATERSKNPHDGKVDSLLLCEYSRRKFD